MSNYTVEQAVIIMTLNQVWFVTHLSSTGGVDLQNLNGQYELIVERKIRPATEEEILAECAKHGWKVYQNDDVFVDHILSPKRYFTFHKYSEWNMDESDEYTPTSKTLKEYCEEGLQAHRFITALNLTK